MVSKPVSKADLTDGTAYDILYFQIDKNGGL